MFRSIKIYIRHPPSLAPPRGEGSLNLEPHLSAKQTRPSHAIFCQDAKRMLMPVKLSRWKESFESKQLLLFIFFFFPPYSFTIDIEYHTLSIRGKPPTEEWAYYRLPVSIWAEATINAFLHACITWFILRCRVKTFHFQNKSLLKRFIFKCQNLTN